MSKPRSFLSSTCYDLADARASLSTFLRELGHEVLASDTLGFGVTPGKHSHVACLDQVDNADFLILIVGGRRGGTHIGSEKSITNEEYRRALKKKIPVSIFVKKDVESASRLYRKNPTGNFSDVVDDVRIFDFIDSIRSRSEDNWIHQFDTVQDIIEGLRAQFAYLHLLFSKRHVDERQPKSKQAPKDSEVAPFPGDFSALAPDTVDEAERTALISGLKAVHGLIKKIRESGVDGIDEKLKVLWLLGRYGSFKHDQLHMTEARFRQRAWSTRKGERVFDQLNEFGASGSYEMGEDTDGRAVLVVELSVGGAENTWALKQYVGDLVKRFDEDEGLEMFAKADMRFYAGDDGAPSSPAKRTATHKGRSSTLNSAMPKPPTGKEPVAKKAKPRPADSGTKGRHKK